MARHRCGWLAIIAGLVMAATAASSMPATPATLTPDVKVFAFIAKRADLSDEQFHAHWREPHGRLARQVPQIRRYQQNHGIGAVPTVAGLGSTPYLGIATIWVADLIKLGAIYGDPGYVEVHADELNLLDRQQLIWLVTREWVLTPGPRPDDASFTPIKAQLLLKRRADVTAQQFDAAIASATIEAQRRSRASAAAYSLAHAEAYAGTDLPPFDAVIELSFTDLARYERGWRRSGTGLIDSLAVVADLAGSRGFLAREERVVWPWR